MLVQEFPKASQEKHLLRGFSIGTKCSPASNPADSQIAAFAKTIDTIKPRAHPRLHGNLPTNGKASQEVLLLRGFGEFLNEHRSA